MGKVEGKSPDGIAEWVPLRNGLAQGGRVFMEHCIYYKSTPRGLDALPVTAYLPASPFLSKLSLAQ